MAETQLIESVQYRDVPGFPGYRVGDDGSVWSAWRTSPAGRKLTGRWRLLKPSSTTRGYLRLNLTPLDGPFRSFQVHRLVLAAFVGPCPPGMEARHLNGVKTDCRLANLSWGTPAQNRQDNRDLDVYARGDDHTQAKLTAADVTVIRARYAAGGIFQRELADEFGVETSNINAIVNRRSWRHIG